MSFVRNCCASKNEVLDSYPFKRDSSEAWSKICGTISLVCLIAFAIFYVSNLINNPNYSLFSDTLTSSQISFVTGTLVTGGVLGISAIYLQGRFRKYHYLLQQHLLNKTEAT